MNARQRFHKTMSFEIPDRVPLLREGIRDDVIKEWREQGLLPDENLEDIFHYDQREEIEPDLTPLPALNIWPTSRNSLAQYKNHLNPDDPARLPADWEEKVRDWREREHILILRLHRGFFQSMGVDEWGRFHEVIELLKDDPEFLREMMKVQSEFAVLIAEKILRDVQVDAILISEPISSNRGPLISPAMYRDLVLNSYEPVLDTVERFGVKVIILRTYANSRVLLPSIVNTRINCLWACECETDAMDYGSIRSEYGEDLRLIGGVDTDILRSDKQRIQHELEDKIPPLLESGGYLPLADGRIRSEIPYNNYIYYRRLLEQITSSI